MNAALTEDSGRPTDTAGRLLAPLARRAAGLLGRVGVPPVAVAVGHVACGAAAAVLIASGTPAAWRWAAAVLLLAVWLDTVDGFMARSAGRPQPKGARHGAEPLVAAALLAALVPWSGPLACLAAWITAAVLQAWRQVSWRSYRLQRTGPPRGEGSRPLLEPLERWAERMDRLMFARAFGAPFEHAALEYRLAWSDRFSCAGLLDVGFRGQVVLLAALLLLGEAAAWPYAIVATGAWALLVLRLRWLRFRRYLSRGGAPEEAL